MNALFASIDIGSHTARLLVARSGKPFPSLKPVLRKRAYTRLAGDFISSGRKIIPDSAVERVGVVVNDFVALAGNHRVEQVYAAATGVLREAENREHVLEALKEMTGLEIRCLDGEQEAALSSLGVVYALGLKDPPYVIFDLGGGSTEIVVETSGNRIIESFPLGASVLTARFFKSDPPASGEIRELESEIERVLDRAEIRIPGEKGAKVIAGTGGTMAALAAVLEGAGTDEIVPERINGVRVEPQQVNELIESWKKLNIQERMSLSDLDEGRAEVIFAGAMVVRGIMKLYGGGITACMSDLLEGLIIESGGKYERK
jgi:exopolyphosphatase/guanosine-5'-triphosphate,3'-diphosphate pyrophosphatase